MRNRRILKCVTGMLFCLSCTLVQAEEVTIPYQSLVLNADLQLAAGKRLADGLIVITHGGLAHRDMEIISYLRSLLHDRGYSTLAINLSLGIDNRHGMYDCQRTHRHRNQDASDEIDAWLHWLAEQQAGPVVLLGHSRGAGQTALYSAEHDNKQVRALVLMAPPTSDNGAAGYQRRYQQPLQPILRRAQQLLQRGQGQVELKHVNLLTCRDTTVTAAAFVSYYGNDPRLDTPTLIPQLHHPALILVAGADQVVIGLQEKLKPRVDGKRIRMKVIDGADHFFRDLSTDDAVDMITAFLAEVPL